MSGNAKRNLVVGTMAVLVCAAVGLNWKYSTQEALQQAEETGTKILGEATLVSGQEGTELAEDTVYEGDDYFASARLTRQQARDSAIELLQKAAEELKASMLTRCCGETRESNLAMRRVFERCGYRLNKTEESYYENPTESACKYVLRREELE